MLKSLTSQGLVLYNRNFREDDKLVKIFTEQAGKRMFFVKHAGKSKLAPVIQPLTAANLLMKINDDGLSYIEDYQDVVTYHRINEDIFIIEQIDKIPQLLFNIWLQRNGLQFAKADRLKLVQQKRKVGI